MLPKERVIEALNHREPDRLPVGEIGIDSPIVEKVLGRKTYYRAKWRMFKALWSGERNKVVDSWKKDIVDLVKKLGLDYVPVFLVPSKKKKIQKPKFINKYTWVDEEGNIWKYSPESQGWPICIKHRKVNFLDELDEIEIDESQFELVRYVVDKLGKTHFILGRGAGPSILGEDTDGTFPETGGLENFLIKMVTDPDFVKKATEISTKKAIKIGKALIQEGCDGILVDCDYCENRGPFMSPRYFREYIFPYLKMHCREFHKKGAYVIKHTDGNTWEILDQMIKAGIDAYQGIQLSAGMDIRKLKEKYAGRLCLFGGVDCETLIKGTRQDIIKETEYAVRYGAPGGGMVLGSGNTIMAGVKYENYMTMLHIVKEKGAYPIRS